jgi:hypothetical protein
VLGRILRNYPRPLTILLEHFCPQEVVHVLDSTEGNTTQPVIGIHYCVIENGVDVLAV